MLQVMVDPKRLATVDVTLDQVQEAVSDALDVGLLRYGPRRPYRHRRLRRNT